MYSIDGKIITVENKFPENKVTSLTFQTSGSKFPTGTVLNGADYFEFRSSTENSVIVNFGDGTIETYLFVLESGQYKFQMNPYNIVEGKKYGEHVYQDGNSGIRNITFEFQNLEKITAIDVLYVKLEGLFPSEINAAKDLNFLRLYRTKSLTEFPLSISENKNLKTVDLRDISESKLLKIPDGLFELDLEVFSGYSVFNLSNVISSNFFKINQWATTLEKLDLTNCGIRTLPQSFFSLTNLFDLRLASNDFDYFPEGFNSLKKLTRFYLGSDDLTFNENSEWGDISELNDLRILLLNQTDLSVDDINIHFRGLFSLTDIFMGNGTFIDRSQNVRFNDFINSFYILCTSQGYLNPSSAPISENYPNKFRNISWGHSSLTQTGNIQAPVGFSQGISNGTPANQGEKIYVLVNNYGHTVITS
jgi:Leucine-rich repeat (LRR) protein